MPKIKTAPCRACGAADNQFRSLNEATAGYSGLELAMNRQGMLRVRALTPAGGTLSQDIVNINFCPMCGRRLQDR